MALSNPSAPDPADDGLSDRELVARLRLIRTPTIGPITYAALIRRFGTPAAALAAIPDLARRGGGKAPRIPDLRDAEAEIVRTRRTGGRYLARDRPSYPPLLAQMEDAPPLLTVAGDGSFAARRSVAMVGARNASAAAIRFARTLAHELGEAGLVVVSGLARGIDTAAHVGALDGGTIAVVAGGLDIYYPPENERLQREIAARGLLVAEQPPGTEPRARHFPYRNRIIAGIAEATIVVEAAPRSGSLITARLANEAGRDVLAVPGSPLDPRAQGCNQLIRDGATLIQHAGDVLDSIGRAAPGAFLASPRHPYLIGDHGLPADQSEIGDAERRRLTALLSPVPVAIDELVRLSGLPPAIVQTVLLELELAGRLDRHAGGRVAMTA